MTLFSYKAGIISVNNKGIYALHNITTIHMVTSVEFDIRTICCYGITVEKVSGSQWATKFCDWVAMANNVWRHKQGELQ